MDSKELGFIYYINKILNKLNHSTAAGDNQSINISYDELKNDIKYIRDSGCKYKLNNIVDYSYNIPLGNSINDPYNVVNNTLQASNRQLNLTDETYYFSLLQNYILLFIIIISVCLFGKFKSKGTNTGHGGVINISLNFLNNPTHILILFIIILSTIYIIYLVINKKFIFK